MSQPHSGRDIFGDDGAIPRIKQSYVGCNDVSYFSLTPSSHKSFDDLSKADCFDLRKVTVAFPLQ